MQIQTISNFKPISSNYSLFPVKNSNHEHELYISNSKLTWFSSKVLYKTLHYSQKIQFATFTDFIAGDSSVQFSLVVLLSNMCKFYLENSETFTINIPFKVARVFPLKTGLLFQSVSNSFYTLNHPLDEIELVKVSIKFDQILIVHYSNYLNTLVLISYSKHDNKHLFFTANFNQIIVKHRLLYEMTLNIINLPLEITSILEKQLYF